LEVPKQQPCIEGNAPTPWHQQQSVVPHSLGFIYSNYAADGTAIYSNNFAVSVC